jgi:DNA polymerase III delta subunit
MVYLFIGADSPAKDLQLKKLKTEYVKKGLEDFNLDVLYARDLTLKALQEELTYLPLRDPKRMLVVRQAEGLKKEIKDYLLKYSSKPAKEIILVLDFEVAERRDEFLNHLRRVSKVLVFKEEAKPDTFVLSRSIESRRTDAALKLLDQLLKNGEKPERILGGLRYAWERGIAHPFETKRRLKLLLGCDIDIKTGRLKPSFALEKLVVGLCAAGKPAH